MEEIVKSQVGAALHLHGEAANPKEFRSEYMAIVASSR
jgi:hypothetical protein